MEQGTLFGNPEDVRRNPCEVCGGQVVVLRTMDPYEDDWHCTACSNRGNASHSRVFGERFEEVTRGRQ